MAFSPFGSNLRVIIENIRKNYPYMVPVPHPHPHKLTPPDVEREFGPVGSYVQGNKRVYAFKDEATRDRFKEKYGEIPNR